MKQVVIIASFGIIHKQRVTTCLNCGVLSKRTNYSATIYGLIAWTFINLLQAFLSPLHDDEAYYWMYSQQLDWGYFDHPPMIALLIKLGAFLSSELAVRFGTVLTSSLSIVVLSVIAFDGKSHSQRQQYGIWFCLLLLACPVVHLYGFITTPDAAMLFFCTLVLLSYQQYLKQEQLGWAVALGIASAGLMYSKYHGILLLAALAIANYRRLLSWKILLAFVLFLLLLLPHLNWQYTHDFPSFSYHLVDRISGFHWLNIPEFLLGSLLLLGPALWLLVYKERNERITSPMERAYKTIIILVLFFFSVNGLRGHLELHWSAIIAYPLVLWCFELLVRIPRKRYKYYVGLSFTVLLLLILRIAVVACAASTLPAFQFDKEIAEQLQAEAGNAKVVFANSFQRASKQQFYTGALSMSFNNVAYRRNQYDLWDFEASFQGQPVLYCSDYQESGFKDIPIDDFNINCIRYEQFESSQLVRTTLLAYDPLLGNMTVLVQNPYNHEISYGIDAGDLIPKLIVWGAAGLEEFADLAPYGDATVEANSSKELSFSLAEQKEGKFVVLFSHYHGRLSPPITGRPVPIDFQDPWKRDK